MSEDERIHGEDAGEQEHEQEPDVPEEAAIDQRIVPFLGDELAAAMTAGGSISITLPGICLASAWHLPGICLASARRSASP